MYQERKIDPVAYLIIESTLRVLDGSLGHGCPNFSQISNGAKLYAEFIVPAVRINQNCINVHCHFYLTVTLIIRTYVLMSDPHIYVDDVTKQ